jgi:hypothetical protein
VEVTWWTQVHSSTVFTRVSPHLAYIFFRLYMRRWSLLVSLFLCDCHLLCYVFQLLSTPNLAFLVKMTRWLWDIHLSSREGNHYFENGVTDLHTMMDNERWLVWLLFVNLCATSVLYGVATMAVFNSGTARADLWWAWSSSVYGAGARLQWVFRG